MSNGASTPPSRICQGYVPATGAIRFDDRVRGVSFAGMSGQHWICERAVSDPRPLGIFRVLVRRPPSCRLWAPETVDLAPWRDRVRRSGPKLDPPTRSIAATHSAMVCAEGFEPPSSTVLTSHYATELSCPLRKA